MAHSNSKKKVKVYNTKKKRVPESKIIQELQSRYSSIDETNATNFSDLPLSSKTLKGLKEHNYVTMTDIQKQSIGLALKGHDILGAAKTGSGKTLAFLIPILEVLYCQQWSRLDGIGALVITPTRELAYQIYETLLKVGRYHDVSAGLIIGGKDLHFEKKRMDQCNIIICTPGRLLQHMDENPLFDCINLKILVLDEADRCLDMGFEKTMNGIIENLPPKRNTLLFSATQTRSVRDLARLSLKDPLYVSVHEHATHSTPEGLQQSYVICNLEDKMAMLWSFLKNHLKQKIIVFFSSCKQVKYTYEILCRMRPGVSLLALYGTLHQLKRMSIYESFCKKQHAVLFATDIAARGLDFPAVNWVVQMDCPEDVNAYIHRAGRTARFQRGGESLLVLLPSELEMVSQLEERKIPISLIKINPNRLFSPHRKLEALLARDVSLKETAQRAFVAYVKSVFLMKDKRIFKVNELNTDDYARSLGLAIPPRIRFLQRMQKKEGVQNKLETEKDKESTASNDSEDNSVELRGRTREEESDASEESEENNKIAKTSFFDKAFSDDSDNDDGFLKIKRKNIDIDAELPNQELEDIDLNSGKKKAVTKAAIAKKILRKKIVPNTKVVFDEEGERVVDPAKLKVSALAQEYEKEVASGINIEMAKQILREEDRYDKQRFREKIKEKHREEKRKLKAAKKKLNDEQESDENSEDEETIANDYDMSYGDGDGDETDTPSLPDFNEDYSKQESSGSEEDQTEEDEQEEQVHRPSKRKLKTRKKDEGTKKKRKSSITSEVNLHADEELALQLLKN